MPFRCSGGSPYYKQQQNQFVFIGSIICVAEYRKNKYSLSIYIYNDIDTNYEFIIYHIDIRNTSHIVAR